MHSHCHSSDFPSLLPPLVIALAFVAIPILFSM